MCWPSAYASGALVKCRKVGAANWGNKSKKDEDGTAPTTPDATNRPSSKSKRISAARFKDKKEGAMEENNKDNKELKHI